MIYLSGGMSAQIGRHAARLGMGFMFAPAAGVRLSLALSTPWAADNGAFTAAWQPEPWLAWLRAMRPARATCLFAVVPDLLGDAIATRARWDDYAGLVRELGYRPAYALQDGCTTGLIPPDAGALFMGGLNCPACRLRMTLPGRPRVAGCTCFKTSEAAYALVEAGKARGLWCHMGRVNSRRRLRAAAGGGYDSADGTYAAFNPSEGAARIGGEAAALRAQLRLPFSGSSARYA